MHASEIRAYLENSRWNKHISGGSTTTGSGNNGSGGNEEEGSSYSGGGGSHRTKVPTVQLITSENVTYGSLGDGLRCLDQKGILRVSTFLLLDGPVVSNMNLTTAIQHHNLRSSPVADKYALTTIMRPSLVTTTTDKKDLLTLANSTLSGSSLPLDEVTIIDMDPIDGRLWNYSIVPTVDYNVEQLPTIKKRKEAADISKTILNRLITRTDLIDTGIYICSPQVGVHFSDHFDYNSLRNHYIHNEVQNTVMDWRFHAHIITEGYGSIIRDVRGLENITKDVVNGWCAPFVPQNSWAKTTFHPTLTLPTGAVVQSPLGKVASSATLKGKATLIGSESIIGNNVCIENSVIGNNCVIKDGSVIRNSIVMARSVIEENCQVIGSIVGNRCIVQADAVVNPGCVLGSLVTIGNKHNVPLGSRITSFPYEESLGLSLNKRLTTSKGSTVTVVGNTGIGRVWPAEGELELNNDDDSDSDDDDDDPSTSKTKSISTMDLNSVRSYIDLLKKTLLTEDKNNQQTKETIASITRQLLRIPIIVGNPGLVDIAHGVSYLAVIPPLPSTKTTVGLGTSSSTLTHSNTDSSSAINGGWTRSGSSGSNGVILSAFEKGIAEILQVNPAKLPTATEIPTISLELKSFKHAENRPFTDVLKVIVPLIFSSFTLPTDPKVNTKEFIQSLQSTINAWTGLFERLRTTVTMEDLNQEYAIISATAAFVCRNKDQKVHWASRFGLLLNFMYDNDIISSDSVTMWNEDAEDISGLSNTSSTDEDADEEEEEDNVGMNIGVDSTDAKLLLSTPFYQKLLARVEEEEDDEDDEEDDEDDE